VQLGTQLFERLKTVAGHVESVGKSLNTSVKHFNSLVGSIETNLLGTTRKLTEEGLKLGRSGDIEDPNAIETQARSFKKQELASDPSSPSDENPEGEDH
jgi:DNA recombination protein RmuC